MTDVLHHRGPDDSGYSFYENEFSHIGEIKKISSQAILTTHNTSIMSNDLLRPDCYFILDENIIKPLHKATKKRLRKAHNLEKMYIANAGESRPHRRAHGWCAHRNAAVVVAQQGGQMLAAGLALGAVADHDQVGQRGGRGNWTRADGRESRCGSEARCGCWRQRHNRHGQT